MTCNFKTKSNLFCLFTDLDSNHVGSAWDMEVSEATREKKFKKGAGQSLIRQNRVWPLISLLGTQNLEISILSLWFSKNVQRKPAAYFMFCARREKRSLYPQNYFWHNCHEVINEVVAGWEHCRSYAKLSIWSFFRIFGFYKQWNILYIEM